MKITAATEVVTIEGVNNMNVIDLCDVYSHVVIGVADPGKLDVKGDAEPTSRLLEGSVDDWAAQEWVVAGTYDGHPCMAIYLFDTNDIEDEDGNAISAEEYPWDLVHLARIIMDEED